VRIPAEFITGNPAAAVGIVRSALAASEHHPRVRCGHRATSPLTGREAPLDPSNDTGRPPTHPGHRAVADPLPVIMASGTAPDLTPTWAPQTPNGASEETPSSGLSLHLPQPRAGPAAGPSTALGEYRAAAAPARCRRPLACPRGRASGGTRKTKTAPPIGSAVRVLGREAAYFLSIASRSLTCSLTFSRMFRGTPA
jgi:hypothetical protein